MFHYRDQVLSEVLSPKLDCCTLTLHTNVYPRISVTILHVYKISHISSPWIFHCTKLLRHAQNMVYQVVPHNGCFFQYGTFHLTTLDNLSLVQMINYFWQWSSTKILRRFETASAFICILPFYQMLPPFSQKFRLSFQLPWNAVWWDLKYSWTMKLHKLYSYSTEGMADHERSFAGPETNAKQL